uniref:Uncharacterized protein n=1 Tax=Apteryx owenii TaxID=8824 RepID=A0A8B9P4I2_APTOW
MEVKLHGWGWDVGGWKGWRQFLFSQTPEPLASRLHNACYFLPERCLLCLFLLCSTADGSRSADHYVVVFPAVIHHSQEEKLCVHLRSLPETVHLAVTLEVEAQNHTLVEQNVEKPGTSECISFEVSVAVIADLAEDALSFRQKSSTILGTLSFSKVLVKPQKNVILVETDKAFYKPGETGKANRWHVEM